MRYFKPQAESSVLGDSAASRGQCPFGRGIQGGQRSFGRGIKEGTESLFVGGIQGRVKPSLAHDFRSESLVCYTFVSD